MTCLSSSSIFTAIDEHFKTLTSAHDEPLLLTAGTDEAGDPHPLTLLDARTIARDTTTTPEHRDTIWRELIHRARHTPDPWRLAAVWMMLPGLSSAVHRISHNPRADIADLRSAVITGFLEALNSIDTEREDLGATLYRSAYSAGRAVCRTYGRELPTDEIDRTPNLPSDPAIPVHRGVATVTRQTQPTRGSLEGERLGSIAHRVGLADHVHRPAQRNRHTLQPGYNGPRCRRMAVRVCTSSIRNLALVPAHPADQATEHR